MMSRPRATSFALFGAVVLLLAGCSHPPGPQAPRAAADPNPPTTMTVAAVPKTPDGAQPRLAPNPAQLADDLVADEHAIRDPSTGEAALVTAAHRQQAAYRAIGQHPEWDASTRPRIPAALIDVYARSVHRLLPMGRLLPHDGRGCVAAHRLCGNVADPGRRLRREPPAMNRVIEIPNPIGLIAEP